jgi:nicotinamidase-related amidase
MPSNIDERQLVTWFASTMRAMCLGHASGTTTDVSGLATSIANLNTADTGLSSQEKALVTLISSAISSTTPSSSIHSQV